MGETKSKILIIGGRGYLGQYMVKASLSLGHPTFAYVRPMNPTVTADDNSSSKLELHNQFEAMGITIFQVGIVISTLAVPQHLDQLKIIKAIQQSGNIKRFIPSEFGNEADRARGLQPFEAMLENKRKIRRATEAAGIPYTYVSANSFSSYFVDYLLHPHENRDEVVVYGSGEAKAVFNYEEDVAAYTIRAATDPRAAKGILICRPQGNIISQLELISAWEKKKGRTLKRIHVPEQEILNLSETLPHPDNGRVSILHNILIKGEQMSFEITDNDLEASKLYPDYKYTSIDSFLDICLVDPSKVKLASL